MLAEIRDSENAYLSDLLLLEELFASPARAGGLSASDARALFVNLEAVIMASRSVLDRLGPDPIPASVLDALVGPAGTQATILESAYAEYVKRHETALIRLAELLDPNTGSAEARAFVLGQSSKLHGRTAAWDLPSLLVKPVQRVLKLPLLLKALVSATPPGSPELPDLEAALERFTQMAEKINEVKRRKEVTEKAARQQGAKSVSHWANKTVARAARQVREAAGLAGTTVDENYDALVAAFYKREAQMRILIKEVSSWGASAKAAAEALETVGIGFAEWASGGGVEPDKRIGICGVKWGQGCRSAVGFSAMGIVFW